MIGIAAYIDVNIHPAMPLTGNVSDHNTPSREMHVSSGGGQRQCSRPELHNTLFHLHLPLISLFLHDFAQFLHPIVTHSLVGGLWVPWGIKQAAECCPAAAAFTHQHTASKHVRRARAFQAAQHAADAWNLKASKRGGFPKGESQEFPIETKNPIGARSLHWRNRWTPRENLATSSQKLSRQAQAGQQWTLTSRPKPHRGENNTLSRH